MDACFACRVSFWDGYILYNTTTTSGERTAAGTSTTGATAAQRPALRCDGAAPGMICVWYPPAVLKHSGIRVPRTSTVPTPSSCSAHTTKVASRSPLATQGAVCCAHALSTVPLPGQFVVPRTPVRPVAVGCAVWVPVVSVGGDYPSRIWRFPWCDHIRKPSAPLVPTLSVALHTHPSALPGVLMSHEVPFVVRTHSAPFHSLGGSLLNGPLSAPLQ